VSTLQNVVRKPFTGAGWGTGFLHGLQNRRRSTFLVRVKANITSSFGLSIINAPCMWEYGVKERMKLSHPTNLLKHKQQKAQ